MTIDVQHRDIQSADAHEPKHITDAEVGDAGKVITPKSSEAGVSELRFLTYSEVAAGLLYADRATFADSANPTKTVTFVLSGITAATNRAWTFPNTSDTFAGLASTQTFTNKTINLASNTLTGTLAQFNTALSGDDFVGLAATQTLTSKTLTSPVVNTPTITGGTATNLRANPRVTALTDAASIVVPGDTTDVGTVTLGGNRTLANPTGTPVNGQELLIRVKQSAAGSNTLTYGTEYRFPGGVAPTITATANRTDYLTFRYHATDARWDCISVSQNFT